MTHTSIHLHQPARGRRHALIPIVAVAALLIALLLGAAHAQDAAGQDAERPAEQASWEFRVCADPNSLPFTHRDGTGFENRLAELLAEEMGATLTYDWSAYSPDMINLRLRGGECDALMGVPDEQAGMLKTVAYYRSPFVFATLESSGIVIESLDDPRLAELRIGVQNHSIPPHEGLTNRGISGVRGPTGTAPNPPDRVLRELMAGQIDVGILWGPNAEYFARDLDAEFVLTPVTPEIDIPFIAMSLPMTIGVRARDYSLRDRLDLAIAARWDDIVALLDSYGVPQTPLPPPRPPVADADGAVQVGVLLPMTTGLSSNATSLHDLVGDAAYRGIELATADLNAAAGSDRFRLQVSSTPSAAAAERAADRLLTVEGVQVLVGGMGAGQSEALVERASEHGALLLDVGSTQASEAARCSATTYFVEASLDDYLSATAFAHADEASTWFVVYEEPGSPDTYMDAPTALAAAEKAMASVPGASVVGSASVAPGQPSYQGVADAVRASGAQGALLLVGVLDQMALLGQVEDQLSGTVLAPLPLPVAQTRDFMGAMVNRVALEAPQRLVVSFEPNRPASTADASAGPEGADAASPAAAAAATAAERYAARYALPMESGAFLGYQAMLILDEATRAAGADAGAAGAAAWAAHLATPGVTVPGPKGPLGFGADRRLVQPLDIVELDPDAVWRNTLADQLALVSYEGSWQPSEADAGAAPDAMAGCEE